MNFCNLTAPSPTLLRSGRQLGTVNLKGLALLNQSILPFLGEMSECETSELKLYDIPQNRYSTILR